MRISRFPTTKNYLSSYVAVDEITVKKIKEYHRNILAERKKGAAIVIPEEKRVAREQLED